MTPHERAEKLVAAGAFWEHDDQVNFGILENEIAAAIRAAENDALERAALALEAEKTPETEDEEVGHDGAYTHAAGVVRALKHGIV